MIDHLPIIDWELALKLAGNKKDLAEDLLALLIASLPHDMATIIQLNNAQDYPELGRQIHKLHGAVCYCGLPRLKILLAHLETELKINIMKDHQITSLLNLLNIEVTHLLQHYSLSRVIKQ